MVNYDDNRRDVSIETIPGPRTQSRLNIKEPQISDSGNYTCRASNTEPASIYVYVSKGKKGLLIKPRSWNNSFVYSCRLSDEISRRLPLDKVWNKNNFHHKSTRELSKGSKSISDEWCGRIFQSNVGPMWRKASMKFTYLKLVQSQQKKGLKKFQTIILTSIIKFRRISFVLTAGWGKSIAQVNLTQFPPQWSLKWKALDTRMLLMYSYFSQGFNLLHAL